MVESDISHPRFFVLCQIRFRRTYGAASFWMRDDKLRESGSQRSDPQTRIGVVAVRTSKFNFALGVCALRDGPISTQACPGFASHNVKCYGGKQTGGNRHEMDPEFVWPSKVQ